MEIRHGLTRRRGFTPALLAGLVAAASVGAFAETRAASEPDRAGVRALATAAAAGVSAQIDAAGRRLAAVSEAIDGNPSLPDGELISDMSRLMSPGQTMGIVRGGSTDTASVAVVVPPRPSGALTGVDLGRLPVFRLALELARDAGGPEVAVGSGPTGQRMVIAVAPLYGSADIPVDVVTRRGSLKGFVVLLAADDARFGLPVASTDADLALRLVQGGVVLASAGRRATGSRPDSAVAIPVTTNGVSWTVEAWPVGTGSKRALVVLLSGLALALVVGSVATRRERSIRRAVAEAESRAQEVSLVARAGPLLQQSLALSDLLPVFAVEISDELGLNGASIDLVTEDGRLARAFSLGPTSGVAEALDQLATPTGSVPAGDVITVPLLRAGRCVGVLRARAVKGLSAPQVDALVAVCNLMAAALGNARLFQDEQEMVARLRGVDRMKTTFVSSVSHELRTTVTAIEGFAGLLGSDMTPPDDPLRDDYLERLRRNARSLAVLVDDLLDFARFERSSSELALKPINLSEFVPQVVDQMSSLLAGRPVAVSVEPDVTALADLSAVERILVNLLSNASKYTPSGSAIEVGLTSGDGVAVLTVADHGPGVPEEEREKVFGLFYRVADPSARSTRGVGIGLALAHQLVDQLGGTITVGDTPGGGATFRVTVPLVEQAPAAPQSPRTPAMKKS